MSGANRLSRTLHTPLEIDILGLRRGDDREDRQHRLSHDQDSDVDIRPVDAVGLQDQPG